MAIRSGNRVMDEKVVTNTNAYLAAYMLIIVLITLVIGLDGQTVETNISAVFACINNIGPGFGAVGPLCNYSIYSDFSKGLLGVVMLIGRLEIFPFLILLSRSTWKR
jgi:trk system potassium uptake protein TrkH